MPVSELNTRLTKKEYHQWIAYFNQKQPDVQEMQMAILTSMVAQGLGSKKAQMNDFLIHKLKPTDNELKPLPMGDIEAVFASFAKPMKPATSK